MSDWTPEPWEVMQAIGLNHTTIRDADGHRLAVVASTYLMSTKTEDANAARIVACVNACAGIPTECLGDDDWKTLMVGRKEREELRAERDALNETIKRYEDRKVLFQATIDALRASLRDMTEYAEEMHHILARQWAGYHKDELDKCKSDIAKARRLLG